MTVHAIPASISLTDVTNPASPPPIMTIFFKTDFFYSRNENLLKVETSFGEKNMVGTNLEGEGFTLYLFIQLALWKQLYKIQKLKNK